MIRPAVAVKAHIEEEKGRWVIFLDLFFWRDRAADDDPSPLQSVRKRIRDFSTKREAEVAAHWIERTADRDNPQRNRGWQG